VRIKNGRNPTVKFLSPPFEQKKNIGFHILVVPVKKSEAFNFWCSFVEKIQTT